MTGEGASLQHFLVAPLQRAIAFAEMDRIAFAVAENLKFDMARIAQVFFKIDGGIAKCSLGLAAGGLHQLRQVFGAVAHFHAAPAAARGRLDDHRIADFGRNQRSLGRIVDRAVGTGHQRQAELARGALRLDLVAHRADMFGFGPDPDDVVGFDDFGKLGVFGQEAIAGMNRIGLGNFCRRNDRRDVQIAVLGRWRPDAHRKIGEPDMHRIGVGGGMHRDRLDPHLARGAMDAQRDFAAIGDQDTLDGHAFSRS